MTDPGKLDRNITIQSYTTSTDAFGQPVQTFATFYTCWAFRNDLSGAEQIKDQVVAETKVLYMIRWDATYGANVTEKMRVKDGSEYFYIESIKLIGRQQWVEMITEKKDND